MKHDSDMCGYLSITSTKELASQLDGNTITKEKSDNVLRVSFRIYGGWMIRV
jgi:hypothetical protein